MKIHTEGIDSATKWWDGTVVTCQKCGAVVEFEANDPVEACSTGSFKPPVDQYTTGVYLVCPTPRCGRLLCAFLGRVRDGWGGSSHTVVRPK